MTKTTISKVFILLFAFLLILAGISISANARPAYASNYSLNWDTSGDPYRAKNRRFEKDVYVSEELYQSHFFEIAYVQVKLNDRRDANSIEANGNGEFPSKYTVLERGTIAKSDLTTTTNGRDKYFAYFTVSTETNCAWSFIVRYQPTEDDSITNDSSTKVLCCNVIDDIAPTITNKNHIFSSGKHKITAKISDEPASTSNSAISGIANIKLYKRLSGKKEEDDELIDDLNLAGLKEYDYTVTVDGGLVEYYIVLTDAVGNEREKTCLYIFSDTSYNAAWESAVNNAITDMEEKDYARTIEDNLYSAYRQYLVVISDNSSTEEEKARALTDLQAAYEPYRVARDEYEKGNIDVTVTITDPTAVEGLEAKGLARALDFLKIGDHITVTLSPTKSAYSDSLKKGEIMTRAGMETATDLYTITISTISTDAFTINRAFSYPIDLKMTIGEYQTIKAVQEVYDGNGNATYYDCIVTRYTDGSINVSVSQTGGNIYIFADSGEVEKKPYWLFSLTAIPVAIGLFFFIFALVKMKKAKQAAQNAQKEQETNAWKECYSKYNKNKKKK